MRQFTLTNEQAQFIFSVLNNQKLCPLPDLLSMRKVNRFFDALEPTVKGYEKRKEGTDIQLTYQEKQILESEGKPLAEIPVTLECERESFAYVKSVFELVVKNSYVEKGEQKAGLGGRHNSRMFVSIIDQLEKATIKEGA
jgi:hypothetical protein